MRDSAILTKNKLQEGHCFKISRLKETIKRTQPHKHEGYYELIFIREGEGFHLVEAENFPVIGPELYFLKPGQLHCWQFTSIPRGFVLLFKEQFFDPISEFHILELIKNLKRVNKVSLPENYDPVFLFEEMFREYQVPSLYSEYVIHGHLQSIFAKVLQLSHILEEKKEVNSLYEKFLNLLVVKSPEIHLVSQCAGLLNTTPQNLNAACRKYASKSAREHITDQMMLEAKRYILHTDMNINEIAAILHFSDPSYFVKYFKKQEGITPLQFRERHFQ